MIRVSNTENLAGVTIAGDFYDLEQLTDALHDIAVNEMDELDKMSESYVNISLRVLGLCYDIRHASQGDRAIFTEENGIADFHLEAHEKIVPKRNVYFSCNILYPEMILNMIALNELIQLRISRLVKSKYQYDAAFDKRVAWDKTIAVIRLLQSAFQEAVSEVLTKPSFSRWQNLIHNKYIDIYRITGPFVDSWNIKYLEMTREERSKKILTVTKRLVEYRRDPENAAYRSAIDQAMYEHGCSEEDLRFDGLDYPEEIDW